MKDAHICPILMRTVVFEDGKCTEHCDCEDCPIIIEIERKSGNQQS